MPTREELPTLHIPTKPPSPSQVRNSADLSLAQRRNLKSPTGLAAPEGTQINALDADYRRYASASDSTAWSPPRISPEYLNKPLPPLPPEAYGLVPDQQDLTHDHDRPAGQRDPREDRKTSQGVFVTTMRSFAKAMTFRRKPPRSPMRTNTRPSNYVDKGTQTFIEDVKQIKDMQTKRQSSISADPSALRQYHATVKAGHDPAHSRRSLRPSMANMKSLKSFLDNTSPSQPGTPTPMEKTSSSPSTPSSGLSPGTTISRSLAQTPLERPNEEFNIPKHARSSGVPPNMYENPGAEASMRTVGTYESQYSSRPGPAPSHIKLPGASNTNATVLLPQTPGSPLSGPNQPAAAMNIISSTRRAISDYEVAKIPTPPVTATTSGLRPPTPMPADAYPIASAPPPTPPKDPLRPAAHNLHLKGRQAELRKSSPSRQSPLRQHVGVNDAPVPSTDTALALSKTPSDASSTVVVDPHRISPSYDHHARAAKQGLPPDAFIPPPTPPAEEYVFRRPIYDYFSTPEGQVVKSKQEHIPHVPDHYQNSLLCPLHPKHRGGQGDYCPIHGGLQRSSASDGSSDREIGLGRISTQDFASSLRTARSRDSDGASDVDGAEYVSPRHSVTRRASHDHEAPDSKYIQSGERLMLGMPSHGRSDSSCPMFGHTGYCVFHGQRSAVQTPGESGAKELPRIDGVESWSLRGESPWWSVKNEVAKIEWRRRSKRRTLLNILEQPDVHFKDVHWGR